MTLYSPTRLLFCLAIVIQIFTSQAQEIKNYVLFSGAGGAGTTAAPSPGNCVQLASGAAVNSGSVGSLKQVITTGGATISGNVYSKGTISLSNNNTVINGNIAADNTTTPPASGTIFGAGSNTTIRGNIDVRGNIVIGSGSVVGKITHPVGTTYSGPTPTGCGLPNCDVTGIPIPPSFPALPPINTFDSAGTRDITNNDTISPGRYRNIMLSGGKTVVFNGPGTYTFNLLQNSGSFNTITFNFQNNPTGIIRLHVHGDVNLAKLTVNFINGGDATRVYPETHGTGSTNGGGWAWIHNSGSSGGRYSE